MGVSPRETFTPASAGEIHETSSFYQATRPESIWARGSPAAVSMIGHSSWLPW